MTHSSAALRSLREERSAEAAIRRESRSAADGITCAALRSQSKHSKRAIWRRQASRPRQKEASALALLHSLHPARLTLTVAPQFCTFLPLCCESRPALKGRARVFTCPGLQYKAGNQCSLGNLNNRQLESDSNSRAHARGHRSVTLSPGFEWLIVLNTLLYTDLYANVLPRRLNIKMKP